MLKTGINIWGSRYGGGTTTPNAVLGNFQLPALTRNQEYFIEVPLVGNFASCSLFVTVSEGLQVWNGVEWATAESFAADNPTIVRIRVLPNSPNDVLVNFELRFGEAVLDNQTKFGVVTGGYINPTFQSEEDVTFSVADGGTFLLQGIIVNDPSELIGIAGNIDWIATGGLRIDGETVGNIGFLVGNALPPLTIQLLDTATRGDYIQFTLPGGDTLRAVLGNRIPTAVDVSRIVNPTATARTALLPTLPDDDDDDALIGTVNVDGLDSGWVIQYREVTPPDTFIEEHDAPLINTAVWQVTTLPPPTGASPVLNDPTASERLFQAGGALRTRIASSNRHFVLAADYLPDGANPRDRGRMRFVMPDPLSNIFIYVFAGIPGFPLNPSNSFHFRLAVGSTVALNVIRRVNGSSVILASASNTQIAPGDEIEAFVRPEGGVWRVTIRRRTAANFAADLDVWTNLVTTNLILPDSSPYIPVTTGPNRTNRYGVGTHNLQSTEVEVVRRMQFIALSEETYINLNTGSTITPTQFNNTFALSPGSTETEFGSFSVEWDDGNDGTVTQTVQLLAATNPPPTLSWTGGVITRTVGTPFNLPAQSALSATPASGQSITDWEVTPSRPDILRFSEGGAFITGPVLLSPSAWNLTRIHLADTVNGSASVQLRVRQTDGQFSSSVTVPFNFSVNFSNPTFTQPPNGIMYATSEYLAITPPTADTANGETIVDCIVTANYNNAQGNIEAVTAINSYILPPGVPVTITGPLLGISNSFPIGVNQVVSLSAYARDRRGSASGAAPSARGASPLRTWIITANITSSNPVPSINYIGGNINVNTAFPLSVPSLSMGTGKLNALPQPTSASRVQFRPSHGDFIRSSEYGSLFPANTTQTVITYTWVMMLRIQPQDDLIGTRTLDVRYSANGTIWSEWITITYNINVTFSNPTQPNLRNITLGINDQSWSIPVGRADFTNGLSIVDTFARVIVTGATGTITLNGVTLTNSWQLIPGNVTLVRALFAIGQTGTATLQIARRDQRGVRLNSQPGDTVGMTPITNQNININVTAAPGPNDVRINGELRAPVLLNVITTFSGTWRFWDLGLVDDDPEVPYEDRIRAYMWTRDGNNNRRVMLARNPLLSPVQNTSAPWNPIMVSVQIGNNGYSLICPQSAINVVENGRLVEPDWTRVRSNIENYNLSLYMRERAVGWGNFPPSYDQLVPRGTYNPSIIPAKDGINPAPNLSLAFISRLDGSAGDYPSSRSFIADVDCCVIDRVIHNEPLTNAEYDHFVRYTYEQLKTPYYYAWSVQNHVNFDPQFPFPGDFQIIRDNAIPNGRWMVTRRRMGSQDWTAYTASHLHNHGYVHWLVTGDPIALLLLQRQLAFSLSDADARRRSSTVYTASTLQSRTSYNCISSVFKNFIAIQGVTMTNPNVGLWTRARVEKMLNDVLDHYINAKLFPLPNPTAAFGTQGWFDHLWHVIGFGGGPGRTGTAPNVDFSSFPDKTAFYPTWQPGGPSWYMHMQYFAEVIYLLCMNSQIPSRFNPHLRRWASDMVRAAHTRYVRIGGALGFQPHAEARRVGPTVSYSTGTFPIYHRRLNPTTNKFELYDHGVKTEADVANYIISIWGDILPVNRTNFNHAAGAYLRREYLYVRMMRHVLTDMIPMIDETFNAMTTSLSQTTIWGASLTDMKGLICPVTDLP